MPISQSDLEHLLRRTEFVVRPSRVSELQGLERAAVVDNILDVPADPGSIVLGAPSNWERSEEYTHFWLNRMAHDSPRPIQEKIGFFWHGQFCSDMSKVGEATLMQEQLDLFRREGLGPVPSLAKKMAVQVAMIRYLDNNDNRRTSPNQNFGRELMELFLLGVGNYTEADVESSTRAWTGHADDWEENTYWWHPEWHDNNPKWLLGQLINQGGDPQRHGDQVIDTIFGAGAVPPDAAVVPNRGRPTREVAAEFLSRKLWTCFAGTTPSVGLIGHLRDVAIANNFQIKPWVRALLVHDEFFITQTKQGLVRSPVDLVVALLYATGRRSEDATPTWLMDGMGQRPQFPPNVSGWRHNGYYVNASAMAQRTNCGQMFFWNLMRTYWQSSGPNAGQIVLPAGTLTNAQITANPGNLNNPANRETDRANARKLVDDLLAGMRLTVSPAALTSLYEYAMGRNRWERVDVLLMIFLLPELHIA